MGGLRPPVLFPFVRVPCILVPLVCCFSQLMLSVLLQHLVETPVLEPEAQVPA
jgi:hypothetical protein